MTEPRLAIEHLTRSFGGLKAVDDVSFSVAAGETIAVVGPNGAGKSTLFQLINGVLAPDRGSIRLDGLELVGREPDAIAALGVGRTFQTSRVFPALSILDSVRIGQTPALIGGGRHGSRRDPFSEIVLALLPQGRRAERAALDARAQVVLELFGDRLWPRRADRADSLSYANRRRLEIARALVAEPTLLLLDEPTAGMNPTETQELAGVIGTIAQERPEMSVVLVEHKLDVVRDLASRVVVMDNGGVLVEGPPEEVLADMRVVEAYLGKRGAEEARARGLAP
jgi:ABC-type branched-subunit amino acid transport system ATPase component